MTLPSSLPHKELFERFMQEYRSCTTYWYVPKARTLGDDYVAQCTKILTIITEHFLGFRWNRETQSALRKRAVDDGLFNPLVDDASEQDQNALIRINKTLLETLGLLWVQDNDEILLTDAGAALLAVRDNDEERKAIVSAQVAKLQYPNPSMSKQNRETFGGIVPYLFLLDVLNRVGGTITYQEVRAVLEPRFAPGGRQSNHVLYRSVANVVTRAEERRVTRY